MLRWKSKAGEKGLTVPKSSRGSDRRRMTGRPHFIGPTFRFLTLICIVALFALPSLDRSKYKNRIQSATSLDEVYMTLLSPPRPPPASNYRIDFEFEATRILGYRILHKSSTKDRHQRRFVVLTTNDVTQEQIDILRADGAEVHPVKILGDLAPRKKSAKPDLTKFELQGSRNEFTKLHLWNMTEYSKILYLDPGVLIIRPLSDLFEIGFSKDRYGTEYLFAAHAQNYTSTPTASNTVENGNFTTSIFLLHPSVQHALYVNAIHHHSIHADPIADMTETSLLRYAYRRDGPYPWQSIDDKYIREMPTLDDMTDGFALLGNFWEDDCQVPWELRRFWYSAWGEMKGYYQNQRLRKGG